MDNSNYNQAIQACITCADECIKCESEAIKTGIFKKDDLSLLLERNCADICTLTATLLQSGFSQAEHIAKECAKNCEAFAAECSKHQEQIFKKCSDICLKCAAECRKLLISNTYSNAA